MNENARTSCRSNTTDWDNFELLLVYLAAFGCPIFTIADQSWFSLPLSIVGLIVTFRQLGGFILLPMILISLTNLEMAVLAVLEN